ncbi:hypothetical protein K440DRAFT_77862 [Wilcoxina mikolae CBS 423.85]|nr:hypothetical protein K440DRAFT_77862 [Wilcoxina mikolae CBS 423.85]
MHTGDGAMRDMLSCCTTNQVAGEPAISILMNSYWVRDWKYRKSRSRSPPRSPDTCTTTGVDYQSSSIPSGVDSASISTESQSTDGRPSSQDLAHSPNCFQSAKYCESRDITLLTSMNDAAVTPSVLGVLTIAGEYATNKSGSPTYALDSFAPTNRVPLLQLPEDDSSLWRRAFDNLPNEDQKMFKLAETDRKDYRRSFWTLQYKDGTSIAKKDGSSHFGEKISSFGIWWIK